ncbi:phospholipase A [Kordiimonas pumila]|uniref:Phospholipase A1 n=1 Tax=Kordiimonas pumila TaxID=2161677 RepID=A0ABV7D927_9PROT|nr:phospholipase A [Kordiimonas pumila]
MNRPLKQISKRLLLAVLGGVLYILAPMAYAEEVVVSIAGNTVTAGETNLATAVFYNASLEKAFAVPKKLEATFLKDDLEYSVLLEVVSEQEVGAVDPEAFQKVLYFMKVPSILPDGTVSLVLPKPYNNAILLHVVHPENIDGAEVSLIKKVEEAALEKETFGSLGGLSTYKPIYFLGGIKPTDAKFQISLKYQLFNEKGSWASNHPWLSGFHLGYTQVSFWDLSSESKPFEDTNFQPEFFYGLEGLDFNFLPKGSEVDLRVGFLHESNGREGDDSRSLNMVYSHISYRHSLGGDWFARLTGDFWSYQGSLSDNPDIADYRGHSSLQFIIGSEKSVQLSAYSKGKLGSDKGSYLFDFTVPMKWEGIAKNLNFSLHGQLFTGYGENLLTYDQKETRFRFGLGIHR